MISLKQIYSEISTENVVQASIYKSIVKISKFYKEIYVKEILELIILLTHKELFLLRRFISMQLSVNEKKLCKFHYWSQVRLRYLF